MMRTILLLSAGPWRIAADPQNVGVQQSWWKEPIAEARPCRVPGIIQETLTGVHGVAWYWTEFTPPSSQDKDGAVLLRFGAVDYLADVWVNDCHVGRHEGGETPFTLDITSAVLPGAVNRLSVRVLNPTDQPIDQMTLAEIPHRNKGARLTVGGSYNYGGITEPVSLILAPSVRVDDVQIKPDWKTGDVKIALRLVNAGSRKKKVRVELFASQDREAGALARSEVVTEVSPGQTLLDGELQIPDHRLWDLEDPFLYRLTCRVGSRGGGGQDEHISRFGFRDFRVVNGYFRLNGKRIFLKSSHTGNHCPIGQILPPEQAKDLLSRDLLYAKASGFNMVRFIAGVAHPNQLDLCDEIGLMVYEECLAGWCLADSPAMPERFDLSVREMILRDRNHPCITIFGLLNETDGPVFQRAVSSLPMVRSLDDTRLVLLGSGRWDGQWQIGSASNPGGSEWEHVWGAERPDFPPSEKAPWGPHGGYKTGAGDAHVYPATPHSQETWDFIRSLGKETQPVFLSEYGIGSLMNAVRELRMYEQHGASPESEDMTFFKATEERLNQDWARWGMEEVYPFPEDMLRESQRLHGRQRLMGFDCIRSNPKICGYNLTGLLDHGFTGEGLWTFWREWKLGIVDVLQDGWAPLRWCLFVTPLHGYVGRPVTVEAVLANEDVLPPGEYPVRLRIMGPTGLAWDKAVSLKIEAPGPGQDSPLAVPVLKEEITLPRTPGSYIFAVNMDRGGAPAGGRLTFRLSEVPSLDPGTPTVALWGIDDKTSGWLKDHGVQVEPFLSSGRTPRVILVGDPTSVAPEEWDRLMDEIKSGSVCLFMSPRVFQNGEDPVARLPLATKGRWYAFPDWLYHKECVAKAHPIFEGVAPRGVMDWDVFGPVVPREIFEGQDAPDEVAAVAFALCHSAPPGGYAAGLLHASYKLGSGRFTLNTLKVLENLDQHPVADRILLNMIQHAIASPLEWRTARCSISSRRPGIEDPGCPDVQVRHALKRQTEEQGEK